MITIKNLKDILNSEEFKKMFDFEAEKKEIEAAGWNYEELRSFGKQIAKQVNKPK